MLLTRAISVQPKPPAPTRTGENVLLPVNKPEVKKHKEGPKQNPDPGISKKALRYFFSKPKSKIDLLYRITRGCLLAYAMVKTPAAWIGLNNVLSSDVIGLTPRANATQPFEQPRSHYGIKIDSFVEKRPGFQFLGGGIATGIISSIDLDRSDTNKNKIALDNSNEINKLIEILSEKLGEVKETDKKDILIDAINFLNETNILYELMWGQNGLTKEEIFQVRGDCQVVADIIAHTLTTSNLEKLKSLIEVDSYSPEKNKFDGSYYINATVTLNGNKIPISYNELRSWRGGFRRNAPEAPYFFQYAIEKELKTKYTPNPYGLSSSSSTLLTGRNYSMLVVPALSNESIKKILMDAPEKSIKAGSYPLLSDYIGRSKELLGGKPFEAEEVINPRIIPYHEYVVKSVKNESGIDYVTVLATDPDNDNITEAKLTIEEFKKNFVTISAPTDTIALVDFKTLETYLTVLLLLLAARFAKNNYERRLLERKVA